MLCSVCIATYKRPQLLRQLLISIQNQSLPPEVRLDVVVVDNDANRSAESVLQEFVSDDRITFSYYLQPIKNISLARNLSIEKAQGAYIMIIDDDETASSDWLATHLKALREFDADGVFGPRIPLFSNAAPEWLVRNGYFSDPYSGGITGSQAEDTWTFNCALKASLVKGLDSPFDPGYGVTGGEDTHLFDRLKQKGAKFIYCKEALVYEYIPPERTRLTYLLKKSFTGGNTHTRRMIELSGRRRLYVRLMMLAKGIAFGTISLLLVICTFPSRTYGRYWMMKLASNAGRLSSVFGWYYQAYK